MQSIRNKKKQDFKRWCAGQSIHTLEILISMMPEMDIRGDSIRYMFEEMVEASEILYKRRRHTFTYTKEGIE